MSKKNVAEHEEVNIVKEIIGFVVYVAFVIFAVWVIITFVGQRTVVDGDSMRNTLQNGDNLWVNKIGYRLHDIERFDIVVFPVENGDYYIKRVIGLPGETVRIDDDGNIYINDEILEENYGRETIDIDSIGRAGENVKLGDDEYFVMGDNRNESLDSRYEEVGNIEKSRIEGKAVFRLWPLSKFGTIKNGNDTED
ncbi:MAG: signal peptidase I [Lachnospiraceae bacterium]|nr:signal peptidase I [Lachnospiraceae bacterium]